MSSGHHGSNSESIGWRSPPETARWPLCSCQKASFLRGHCTFDPAPLILCTLTAMSLLFPHSEQIPGLRRLDVGGIIHVNDSVLESIASKLSLTHIGLSG